jgi:hypothetical protein
MHGVHGFEWIMCPPCMYMLSIVLKEATFRTETLVALNPLHIDSLWSPYVVQMESTWSPSKVMEPPENL